MMFMKLYSKCIVNKLHIGHYFFFAALSRAFTKTTVIHQNHIIIVPVKILCIFCPTFYAACIPVKVQDEAGWFIAIKMQAINCYSLLHIKKQFRKRNIIFVSKIFW